MTSAVATSQQTIDIGEIVDVVTTPAVSDGNGGFVREIRVFGTRPGGPDASIPVFILRITGASAAAIAVTTPELTF